MTRCYYPWFAGSAVFVGSVLLFSIQPAVAKVMLPNFGGSSVVWTATLAFFQISLLLGYALAAIGAARSQRVNRYWAIAALATSCLFLPVGLDGTPDPGVSPSLAIAGWLVMSLLAPVAVLAAASPMLASWGALLGSRRFSPYRYYAVSNAGSLIGLVSYPFIVEPWVGLDDQLRLWSWSYVGFVVLCVGAVASLPLHPPTPAAAPSVCGRGGNDGTARDESSRFYWFALSAAGVVILVAGTTKISLNLAAFPLLWIVPLALYLISYIVTFSGAGLYRRRLWISTFAMSILPTLWLDFIASRVHLVVFLSLHLLSIFAGCMVCHGELYRRRPFALRLTRYYLWSALGAATAGLFTAAIAPRIFTRPWEHSVGLWSAFVLAIMVSSSRAPLRQRWSRILAFASVTGLLVYLGALPMTVQGGRLLALRRTPYSTLEVYDRKRDGEIERVLVHGDIVHGTQWQRADIEFEPTAYYRREGAIGDLLSRDGPPRAIAVVGLGVGAIATYGRHQDRIRFYEIDPAVEELARRHFSFLSGSAATIEVVIGDARLSLTREGVSSPAQRVDLLILDAFSSGAVPIHLLTLEAFEVYSARVADAGAIAVNVASTYVDLEGVVRAAATELGWRARRVVRGASNWLILSRKDGEIGDSSASGRKRRALRPWTDQASDLATSLRW